MTLSKQALDLFDNLFDDADNWSGTPLFEGSNESKGHLTALKKAGLLTTQEECRAPGQGGGLDVFVIFTTAGKKLGDERSKKEQAKQALIQKVRDIRHEVFEAREHGDEFMRQAQDLLGNVISLMEASKKGLSDV